MRWLLSAALCLGPSVTGPDTDADDVRTLDRLSGFDTVVVSQVNATLGTEHLPVATGLPVEPGLLVTVTGEQLQVFDGPPVDLRGDASAPTPCRSGCPAVMYDALASAWLAHAIESSELAVEIPTRVLFAVDSRLPAKTLVAAAYAAAETRPVQPPELALLLNSAGRGMKSQSFHLLPPTGLELGRGAAALGLTIELAGETMVVSANAPDLAAKRKVADLRALAALLAATKRRHPGKETVILVPSGDTSVARLLEVIVVAREAFPNVVLSAGQPIVL